MCGPAHSRMRVSRSTCVSARSGILCMFTCVCPSSASLLVSAGPHLILSPTFLSFVDRILSSREEVRSLRAPLMSAPSGHPVNSSELDWLNDEPRGTTAGSPAKESQWGTELPLCVSLLSREHVLPNTPPTHFSTPRAYKGLPPSLPFLLYPHELLFILQSPVLLDPLPGHLPCPAPPPPPPCEWRTGRCWLTQIADLWVTSGGGHCIWASGACLQTVVYERCTFKGG